MGSEMCIRDSCERGATISKGAGSPICKSNSVLSPSGTIIRASAIREKTTPNIHGVDTYHDELLVVMLCQSLWLRIGPHCS